MTFATGISSPVDLKVSDDGALYYLARGTGSTTGVVYRIDYGAAAPTITTHPSSQTVQPGASVTFSVSASGARRCCDISGSATASTSRERRREDYIACGRSVGQRRAVPGQSSATTPAACTSNEAVLTVTANQAPTGTISQPAAGTLYSGGSVITYSGTATDPEDGTLPASAFTWRVDFHHDTHTHPFIAPTTGATSGSFTIPTTGQTESNVWYRIYLTVQDSDGLTHTTQRDIMPRTVRLTLATNPAGLQLKLDGQPVTTPLSFDSVVGIVRNIEATPQTSGGTTYGFVSWSDGGAARHNVSTPAANTTYTATYRVTGGTARAVGDLLRQLQPHRHHRHAHRSDGRLRLGAGSPAPAIGVDTFSARWTGQIQPQFSETYTFYTVSDDGVRLWVNGQRVVNNWTNHTVIENSGTIALTAGQRYAIRMEFYENTGNATARLLWSSPSTPKAVVPSARLFPQ